MSSDSSLRAWLRRCGASKLRIDEGKTIAVSKAANRWSVAENTIMRADACLVEALNEDGDIMSSYQVKEPDDSERPAQKENWPKGETAELAMVITASNDRSALRHENAYKMAFKEFKDMYRALREAYDNEIRRCAQLEAALQRELARTEVPMPSSEDELNGLIAPVVARLLQGEAPKEPTQ